MSTIRIQNLSLPELAVYSKLTEAQLHHDSEIDTENGLFIAESPNVIERALDAGFEPVSMLMDEKQIHGAAEAVILRAGDIPVYTASAEILTELTGFHLTRGILCAMHRKKIPTLEEICADASRIAVLENVMNPTNLGAIFRSAAALGIDAVLLTPGCTDPLYRRCVRVSMGTVFQVPWAFISNKTEDWPNNGMYRLKKMGFRFAAMALRNDTIPISDPTLKNEGKLAIVLGTEGEGLLSETISKCDYTVKIPMSHGVDSLNVAAASAVAFWELCGDR